MFNTLSTYYERSFISGFLLWSFILFLSGCGGISAGIGELAAPEQTVSALRIIPQVSILSQGETLDFAATGGQPPYEFFKDSGPSELSSLGGYRAEGIGLEVINVRDSLGNLAHATVFVQPKMFVLPQTATVVSGESRSFNIAGGVAPYTAEVISGSGTIEFESTLVLRFTATGGLGPVIIRVEDSQGAIVDLNIDVNGVLNVTPLTVSLPIGEELSFEVEGGVPPYAFATLAGPGSVGADSGVYIGYVPGTVSLRVADSAGHSLVMTVTNTVAPLELLPTTLTLAVGNVYLMRAQGGFAPYTYSIDSGAGSIDASSGLYLAAMAPGATVLKVTD